MIKKCKKTGLVLLDPKAEENAIIRKSELLNQQHRPQVFTETVGRPPSLAQI